MRKEYELENTLIKHQEIVHSAKPILRCVLGGCKSRFVEESALQKHLLWHKSQGVLKCGNVHRASLTVENTTAMEEFNADNVEEFVERMNSILLTQRNENKSKQTQDVYRCSHCEFSTEDKTQYTKHYRHHAYLIRKQKNAEPQSHTCDKCETIA
ncbi:unnamed protein product [Mytilus edulis]|uniref:C2H2-type domain-containing protein n=1 Tax=Mytilus edulis TaxID=6550 RepID=A0A8S3QIH7_MYTED|nr:unnamed protein product [Mytilus edulis]